MPLGEYRGHGNQTLLRSRTFDVAFRLHLNVVIDINNRGIYKTYPSMLGQSKMEGRFNVPLNPDGN